MIARGAGVITRTLGETAVAALPAARVGDGVTIASARGAIPGEIAAVERGRAAIVAYASLAGVGVGDRVTLAPQARLAPVGFAVLGRALDAAGRALDGGAELRADVAYAAGAAAPEPGDRQAVNVPLWTGVRAIDALLTIGRGARVGIFGSPGAGKTTLLETIAAGVAADVCVLALVGERGREAQAWLARLDRRTSIVCATSDRSAGERVRAAEVAMTQAEFLRARGLHVVLIVDSLARYAAALRERAVTLGEPVGRGGYPPSVWAELARFLERAGTAARGSITLLATVLTDGADERDPLSDAARSLLDGHLVLSPTLARAGRFPAIDVLASASRTMTAVVSAGHLHAARAIRGALAMLDESAEARALGLTSPPEESPLGRAIRAEPEILAMLRQEPDEGRQDVSLRLRALAALLEAA